MNTGFPEYKGLNLPKVAEEKNPPDRIQEAAETDQRAAGAGARRGDQGQAGDAGAGGTGGVGADQRQDGAERGHVGHAISRRDGRRDDKTIRR